jgi:hypothetical protein
MPDLSEVRSYRIWKQLIENAAAKSATANLDSPISDVPLLRLEAALRFLATVESKRRASGVLQGISLAKGEDGDQDYPRHYDRERNTGEFGETANRK